MFFRFLCVLAVAAALTPPQLGRLSGGAARARALSATRDLATLENAAAQKQQRADDDVARVMQLSLIHI